VPMTRNAERSLTTGADAQEPQRARCGSILQ
jgi:hypothetical protein